MSTQGYRDLVIETDYYAKLYGIADSDGDGRITGKEGASFLRRSGLSDKVLEQIWELAGKGNAFMTQKEFAVAMRLVSMAQQGKQLNINAIHDVFGLPSFKDIIAPALLPPQMAEEDVRKYDQLFLIADADKDGFVDGLEAKAFFSRSDLPPHNLSAIWKLSERDGDGKLSKAEFRLAMNLIYWVLGGNPMPSVLPQSIIDQALNMHLFTAPTKLIPNNQKVGGPSAFITSLQVSNTNSQKSTVDDLLGVNQQTSNSRSLAPSGNFAVAQQSSNPQTGATTTPQLTYNNSKPQSEYNAGLQISGITGKTNSTQAVYSNQSSQQAYSTNKQAQQTMQTSNSQAGLGTNQQTAFGQANYGTNLQQTSLGFQSLNPQLSSNSQQSNFNTQQSKLNTQQPNFNSQQTNLTGQQTGFSTLSQNTAPPPKSFSSPFGETPFAQALASSPFGETPFAKAVAQQSTTSSNSASSSVGQQFAKPNTAKDNNVFGNSDPFGSSSSNNSNELQWVPVESGHNYDQSKYVFQHSMPGTTFEMRANFTSELSDAMKKVKNKD